MPHVWLPQAQIDLLQKCLDPEYQQRFAQAVLDHPGYDNEQKAQMSRTLEDVRLHLHAQDPSQTPSSASRVQEPNDLRSCIQYYRFPDWLANRRSRSSAPAPSSNKSTDLAKAMAPFFPSGATSSNQPGSSTFSPSINPPREAIRVVHSDEVNRKLRSKLANVKTRADCQTDRDLEQHIASVADWNQTHHEAFKVIPHAEINYEVDQSSAARPLLAEPINRILRRPQDFRSPVIVPTSISGEASQWVSPKQEKIAGVTDWVLMMDQQHRALMEWKRLAVLSDEDLGDIVNAASSNPSFDLEGRMISTGFQFWVENNGVRADPAGDALRPNSLKVNLQVWTQTHHYKCRWLALYNTSRVIVFYLAAPRTLWVGDVVQNDGSGQLNIAWVLLALGLITDDDVLSGSDPHVAYIERVKDVIEQDTASTSNTTNAPRPDPGNIASTLMARPVTRSRTTGGSAPTGNHTAVIDLPHGEPSTSGRSSATYHQLASSLPGIFVSLSLKNLEPHSPISPSRRSQLLIRPRKLAEGRLWDVYESHSVQHPILQGGFERLDVIVMEIDTIPDQVQDSSPLESPRRSKVAIGSVLSDSPDSLRTARSSAADSYDQSQENNSSPPTSAGSDDFLETRETVVKICKPVERSSRCGYLESSRDILDSILHEVEMYHLLRGYQGNLVPRMYGHYVSDGADGPSGNTAVGEQDLEHCHHMVLLSPAGKALAVSWQKIHDSDIPALLLAMDTLHALGVCHGDLEPWHLRWNTQLDRVQLIDFDRAFRGNHEDILNERRHLAAKLGISHQVWHERVPSRASIPQIKDVEDQNTEMDPSTM